MLKSSKHLLQLTMASAWSAGDYLRTLGTSEHGVIETVQCDGKLAVLMANGTRRKLLLSRVIRVTALEYHDEVARLRTKEDEQGAAGKRARNALSHTRAPPCVARVKPRLHLDSYVDEEPSESDVAALVGSRLRHKIVEALLLYLRRPPGSWGIAPRGEKDFLIIVAQLDRCKVDVDDVLGKFLPVDKRRLETLMFVPEYGAHEGFVKVLSSLGFRPSAAQSVLSVEESTRRLEQLQHDVDAGRALYLARSSDLRTAECIALRWLTHCVRLPGLLVHTTLRPYLPFAARDS